MKTQDEIVAYCQEAIEKGKALFDFRPDAVAQFLDIAHLGAAGFEAAHPDEYTPTPLTEDAVIATMREYMAEVAWEKALGERGLSAVRSIQKFDAWLWLLGDEETRLRVTDDNNYEPYGRPALRIICERYGFPIEG